MRTTCTALYGCISRQRSIVAWNRLTRPFTLHLSRTDEAPRLETPMVLDAVPDVRGVDEVRRVDVGRFRGNGVSPWCVRLDPCPRNGVRGEVLRCRETDVS